MKKNKKVTIGEPPTEIEKIMSMTPEMIKTYMFTLGIHQGQIVRDLDINRGNLSAMLSGKLAIPDSNKKLFYYYFLAKRAEKLFSK